MIGAGFRGNWIDLKESYRLPDSFISYLSAFIYATFTFLVKKGNISK